jgi:hypothetical protein
MTSNWWRGLPDVAGLADVGSSSAGAAHVLAAQVENLDQGFVGREVPRLRTERRGSLLMLSIMLVV